MWVSKSRLEDRPGIFTLNAIKEMKMAAGLRAGHCCP